MALGQSSVWPYSGTVTCQPSFWRSVSANASAAEDSPCTTKVCAGGLRQRRAMAKAITLLYMGITILALLVVRSKFLTDPFSYWYIGAGLVVPLLISAGFTYQASDRQGHSLAGHVLKAAMAIAITFAFFIRKTL